MCLLVWYRSCYSLQHAIGDLQTLSLEDFEEKVSVTVCLNVVSVSYVLSLQYTVDFDKYRSYTNLT